MTDSLAPILDGAVLEALRDSVGGDVEFVVDLVNTYLDDTERQLAAIDTAVAAGDAAALIRPAHTLKSGSLTLGVMRLGEAGRALEQRGRSGDLSGASSDAVRARAEWTAARTALADWLSSRSGAA